MTSPSRLSFRDEWSLFRKAIRQQVVVIRALILREVRTRFGRHYGGYVWALLEPCFHIGAWFLIFSLFKRGTFVHDMHPLLFLATGLVAFFLFSKVSAFIRGSLNANKALLQFPLVKPFDTVISRFLLESCTMIIVGSGILGLLILLGYAPWPDEPLKLFGACAVLLCLAFGFGTLRCTTTILFPVIDKFDPFINRLLYFTSGIFFSIDKMPAAAQEWLKWNPVLHGVELFRSAWSFSFESRMATPWYPVTCGLVFLLIALLLERPTRRTMNDG